LTVRDRPEERRAAPCRAGGYCVLCSPRKPPEPRLPGAPLSQAQMVRFSKKRYLMFDRSLVWKWLRGSGKRRATVRKPARVRLALEALDERIMLSVTEFPIMNDMNSRPEGITRGPDGNLWFIETLADRIGRITPAGVVTEFSAGITTGS